MSGHTCHVTVLTRSDVTGDGDPRTAWHERRAQLDRDGVDYKHNDSNLTIQWDDGDVTVVEAYRKAEE